jgi:hypothetical protein
LPDLVGGVTTYRLSHTSSSRLIEASLLGITLVMIGKFIGQLGKQIASRAHLPVNFIKNRGKTALTPDFKTKIFPGRFFLIETGHKLFKGHQQQTVFLSVSLKPIALNNSEPNEIKVVMT